MFTGLVEGRGIVKNIRSEGATMRLGIEPPATMCTPLSAHPDRVAHAGLGDAKSGDGPAGVCVGDSVAINGCCLTVVDTAAGVWTFEAGAETLSRTNLGRLHAGDSVNLERALPANARLGGHIVQGHIDGLAEVDTIARDGQWVTMWFRLPEQLALYMVPKGSVAVDGVSLTLVNVERNRFSVALIPHTLDETVLGLRKVGDAVNVETDLIGKYVYKYLSTLYGS